jgi:spore protease
MNHEIDLKSYHVHSDLAIDYLDNDTKITGINHKTELIDGVKVSRTYLDKEGGKSISKKEGNYTTIEFEDITDYSNKESVKKIFSEELKAIFELNNIKEDSSCLIIGLGNSKSTPDSLGPLAIGNILVTNHLFTYGSVEEGFRRTFAFMPGVMAQTGIETSDAIMSLANQIKPGVIIVIDALASGSIDRVNKTIQMTDTGIHPGSGVGNNRKEISKDTINIPVIAIGVPTVVDAVTIVSDTMNYMFKHYAYNKEKGNKPKNKLVLASKVNYLKEEVVPTDADKQTLMGLLGILSEDEVKQLIYEVLTPIGYNLMVTPKEVDFIMEKLSDIIGNGINRSLHRKVENL